MTRSTRRQASGSNGMTAKELVDKIERINTCDSDQRREILHLIESRDVIRAAEVERLDQEVKTLTAERERLNKALEQATSNSLGPRLPDPSHTVTVSPDSVEFPNEGGYPVFAQCHELAAWLKENRS